jgi:D-alanine-D-alanine ligase
METFGETQLGLIGVLGVMDVLGLKYTGGGPGEIYLQEDKGLSKKLLAYEKIAFPDFAVFGRDADMETAGNLRMPLFVKPLRMDASIGIDASKSLVDDAKDMMRRVAAIHKLGDCALVEEYIEGREFLVGVLGNRPPVALPPVEIDFSGLPKGELPVFDAKAKWAKRSKRYKGTKAVIADIPDDLKGRLQRIAVDACRALRVREYARVDMRMNPAGEVYVIEVNASCYLDREGEFAMSAAAAGIEFAELVDRIATLAAERHGLIKPNGKNGH